MHGSKILEEDFRAALKEIVGFIDISEQDLIEIYKLAQEHARKRVKGRVLVEQVMSREVHSVNHQAHPHEAETLLFRHRISGLPVVDEENRVVGVVSEKDFLYRMEDSELFTFMDRLKHFLHNREYTKKIRGEKVEEMMSAPAVTVTMDMTVNRVATLLVEKKINRVPVVDKEGKLVGIVSRADLLRVLHDEHQKEEKR